MVPINVIKDWSHIAPWINDEQIEQDLVICRSLVEIFSDEILAEKLAFRSGTALHKIFLQPQKRYSEDIDLVQKESGPIKEILSRIQQVLSFIGESRVKQSTNNNTLLFRFQSENTTPVNLRLKVEINCREHFNVLGDKEIPFSVNTNWFSGEVIIQTYELKELLGTKLRALYQRKKGRDLYDLYKSFILANPDPAKIILCYHEYMKFVVEKIPTKKQFIMNMDNKIGDDEFINDTAYLLSPTEKYDHNEAYELIRSQLLARL